MQEIPEILKIRKLLKLSRPQFGRMINRSEPSIRRYEEGAQVPLEVLINARKWENLFYEIYGLDKNKGEADV